MTIPNDDGFVGASVTEDQFKQNLVQLLDHIRSLTSGFDLKNGKVYDFASILDFEAIKTKIPAGSIVVIEWGEEYGAYVWDGTNLTKSQYDLLALAKSDATAKAATAKSEAISAAATDASTKANTAETNAKLAAQNTDVKLLLALQQIIQTISDNRDELDITDAALSAEDQLINTRITRLLVSIQQITKIIAENRDELDTVISTLDAAQTTALNAAISKLQSDIDTGNTRLNLGLHKFVDTITLLLSDLQETFNYFSEEEKLKRLLLEQEKATEFSKLNGFNPENVGNGRSVNYEDTIILPTPDQIIRIDLEVTSALPTAKGTVINSITTINVDGQIAQTYGTIEVQGSSSALMPKKNWSIAIFSDDSRQNAINIKLGHMLPHDELVWKAYFVDNTQTRNNVSNLIWEQFVQTRNQFPKSEVDRVNMIGGVGLDYQPTGALGHVDGFPAVCYINGEFYGIGALNIGKKRGNYNLASNKQTHIQLEPNGGVIINKLPLNPLDSATPALTGEAFEIRRPSKWGNDAQASYERLRAFLASSKADMINAGVDNYLDRYTTMDYIILVQLLGLGDTFHKNTLYTTWDGLVWHFMPYDLDCTCGLNSNGKVEFDPLSLTIPNSDTTNSSESDWWNNNFGTIYKIRSIYGSDLDARYAQLRKKVITVDNLTEMHLSWAKKIPKDLYELEDAKWNKGVENLAISMIQSSSIYQINDWLSKHIPRCDSYFNYIA